MISEWDKQVSGTVGKLARHFDGLDVCIVSLLWVVPFLIDRMFIFPYIHQAIPGPDAAPGVTT
jgi:phage shock protein PspC (stress-responsive transcriptional regulator)